MLMFYMNTENVCVSVGGRERDSKSFAGSVFVKANCRVALDEIEVHFMA